MEDTIVTLITSITALCAVILSPLVSVYVVKRQTGVSVLSNNRQNWINSLRDDITEFVTLVTFVHVGNYGDDLDLLQKLERSYHLMIKINLMLNPNESDHIELISLLNKASKVTHCYPDDRKIEEWNETKSQVIPLSQKILKREWNRVKKVA